MRIIFLCVVMLFASPLLAKKVYKYVDETGNTHYVDEPIDGATEIILPKPQTYQAAPVPTFEPEKKPQKIATSYNLIIIEPDNDFVLHKNETSLHVKTFVEPNLEPNHVIQLFIDDTAYQSPQKEPNFEVQDLTRGSHTIVAKVIDTKNRHKILNTSMPITVHVQKAIVPAGNPARAMSLYPRQDSE